MSITLLSIFVPTFFFVSITPGMCMTLALTLGMSIGIRRSLHMMWGRAAGGWPRGFGGGIGCCGLNVAPAGGIPRAKINRRSVLTLARLADVVFTRALGHARIWRCD